MFLLAPQPLRLQSCGSGHHGMSLIVGSPSGRSSSLRQLISAKWARAPSRVPHLSRRPGYLRRHRLLELRGPVAGGTDEGTGSRRAVTNCMKGVKIAGTSPEQYSQCPPLLDEPATDTLLVISKVHVCPVSLCLRELSQVRERAEARMFGGQGFIAGFVLVMRCEHGQAIEAACYGGW